MSHAMAFNDHNFTTEVLESDRPVLVDFWAPWCGPCRLVGPTIDSLSDDIGDGAKVGKLNIDENPQTASEFAISSIPTVLVFRNGKVIERLIGVQSAEAYRHALHHAAA